MKAIAGITLATIGLHTSSALISVACIVLVLTLIFKSDEKKN